VTYRSKLEIMRMICHLEWPLDLSKVQLMHSKFQLNTSYPIMFTKICCYQNTLNTPRACSSICFNGPSNGKILSTVSQSLILKMLFCYSRMTLELVRLLLIFQFLKNGKLMHSKALILSGFQTKVQSSYVS